MRATIEKWIILAILTGLWTALALAYWPANALEPQGIVAGFAQIQREGSVQCQTLELRIVDGTGAFHDDQCRTFDFPIQAVFRGQQNIAFDGSSTDGLLVTFHCIKDGWNVLSERGNKVSRFESRGDTEADKFRFEKVWRDMVCDIIVNGEAWTGRGQMFHWFEWEFGGEKPRF